jgi:hypothetical protein
MEKNELKQLIKLIEPMSIYYSMMVQEKDNKTKEINEKVKVWSDYALVVKNQIKIHRAKIILALKGEVEFGSSEYLFDKAWEFLKRNQLVHYKETEEDGFGVWDFVKDDFKMLDYLDKMVEEINLLTKEEKKEELRLFIEKYVLIAQKELETEKNYVVDNIWLTGKVHANNDVIPKNVGAIVNIIKAQLRIPKRKIRKKVDSHLLRSIGDRDGWKCQICGVDLSHESSAWEVNHIDCNPANNDPKNLELTCRNCNKKYRV